MSDDDLRAVVGGCTDAGPVAARMARMAEELLIHRETARETKKAFEYTHAQASDIVDFAIRFVCVETLRRVSKVFLLGLDKLRQKGIEL